MPLAGNRIDGEDLFVATDGDMMPADVPDEFAVRFHLHPSVKANKLTDGHGAMLMLPNRDVWTFNAYEDRVEIEESVYLVRLRRPAPRRADRDLRPRPQSPAGALDLRPCRVVRLRAPRRKRGDEPRTAAERSVRLTRRLDRGCRTCPAATRASADRSGFEHALGIRI